MFNHWLVSSSVPSIRRALHLAIYSDGYTDVEPLRIGLPVTRTQLHCISPGRSSCRSKYSFDDWLSPEYQNISQPSATSWGKDLSESSHQGSCAGDCPYDREASKKGITNGILRIATSDTHNALVNGLGPGRVLDWTDCMVLFPCFWPNS